MSDRSTVIVAAHWRDHHSELSYVTRSIAGAATRSARVSVLVPGSDGREPDGAFDLIGMGQADDPQWPAALSPDCTVVVDDLTAPIGELLSRIAPRRVLYLVASADASSNDGSGWLPLRVIGAGERDMVAGMYVAVNPAARRQRHHGFGFTGYHLVLSDGTSGHDEPPPAAAWLTAAFHDADVVVIEDAVASVWKGRALRGRVSVDTRMDLWRLLAHAHVCVDLAPGALLARECVEALRFGTPIIVRETSGVAATHAIASGGAVFGDPGELIASADTLRDRANRTAAAQRGQRYADKDFGDVGAFVSRVASVLVTE